MHLLQILPLFFLLGEVEGKDVKKLENILKKVGKRYLLTQNTRSQDHVNYMMDRRNDDWAKKSDEEIRTLKEEQMTKMGNWFMFQNEEGTYSIHWGDQLSRIFARDLNATFCGSGKYLNYYQLINYLAQTRKGYLGWLGGGGGVYPDTKFRLEDTNRDILFFTISFNVKSKLGHVATVIYRVIATLNVERMQGWCDFIVRKVEILGDCPDYGNVQGKFLSQQDLWKKDTEVQKVLRLFNREEEAPLHPEQIPRGWLNALDPNEHFTAITCSPEKTIAKWSAKQFRKWYDRLDIMWHPKGDLKAQILELKENEEIVARITMPLQLGWNEKEPARDWEFKIKALYNTKGDNQWYITEVQGLCPAGLDIIEEYRKTMPLITSEHFKAHVTDRAQWFTAIEYLPTFLGANVELWVCNTARETVQVDSLAQLETTLWRDHNWRNGSFANVEITPSEGPVRSPVYETTFRMDVIFSVDHVTNVAYVSKWTFWLQYSDADMFYYISKVDIGCQFAEVLQPMRTQ